MGTNYYFDRKNSRELSESISKMIGFLDADTVRERLFDRIHICKISAGWKPGFQRTEYFSSLDELKEFYKQNKDKYNVIDEYDEHIDFNALLEKCRQRYDDTKNKSHLSEDCRKYYRKCSSGYEWCGMEFS